MNTASVIVLVVVASAASFAIWRIGRRGGCSRGCSGCPHSGDCDKIGRI